MNNLPYMLGVYGLMVPGTVWLAWMLEDPGSMPAMVAALSMILAGYVVILVFVYNKWKAIQDGKTRTSPGSAVGLLLVPFFNIYWAFRVWPGFADEYNAFARRNDLDVPDLPRQPYTALVVCSLASGLPAIGIVAGLAYIVLLGVTISMTCNAVNAIDPDRSRVQTHLEPVLPPQTS